MSVEKLNISFSIRAVDRFTKTHNKLHRQLDNVKRHVESLSNFESIKVDADTASFNRKMDRAKRKADSFPKVKTTNVLVVGFRRYRDEMDRLAQSLRTFDEIARGMTTGGLLTMLPAIVPLIGVAAGGIMALGSAFSSAALGAAGFGAVAIPAIAGVVKANEELADAQKAVEEAENAEERAAALEELANIQKQYSKAQLESVGAIRKFTSFYKDFAKQFEPDILGTFNKSLATLQKVMKLAEPAISGVVIAVDNLVTAFDKNLGSDDMQRLFDWLGNTAGPYLEGITKAVGNFAAGLLNMFVAFDPLAESFVNGFLRMSEQFREWSSTLSENQSFQNFMAYVQEHTPTVLSLIGNIVTTLVNLGIAMEPLATKVLEMANSFFAFTSELFKNHKWVGMIIGALPILVGLFKLLSPIVIAARNAFQFLTPFILKAFTWFGKLGIGIQKVFPIITRIGARLLRLAGGPMGIAIQAVIALAIVIASNWDAIWAKTKEIFGKVKDWVTTKIAEVVATGVIIWGWIKGIIGYFGDLWDGVKKRMSDVGTAVTDGWNTVMEFLSGIDLFDIGANIMEGLKNGIVNAGKNVIKSVKGVVDDAITGAKKLLGIASPSKVFRQFGIFTGEGFVIGMDKMRTKVSKASERMTGASIPKKKSKNFQGIDTKTAPYRGFRTSTPEDNDSARYDDEARYTVEVPVYLNGREIAKASADDITRIQERKEKRHKKLAGEG